MDSKKKTHVHNGTAPKTQTRCRFHAKKASQTRNHQRRKVAGVGETRCLSNGVVLVYPLPTHRQLRCRAANSATTIAAAVHQLLPELLSIRPRPAPLFLCCWCRILPPSPLPRGHARQTHPLQDVLDGNTPVKRGC